MLKLQVLGAGKIGITIYNLLEGDPFFAVNIFDNRPQVANLKTGRQADLSDQTELEKIIQDGDIVVSALPFHMNKSVADAAIKYNKHYFDLTEDVATTKHIAEQTNAHSGNSIFVPQCGLAPGYVSIVAMDLFKKLKSVEKITMRVGALPLYPDNRLKYNLTWSTAGLINEYIQPCPCLERGTAKEVKALEGYERFFHISNEYEAFNTSGGIGSLITTLEGKIDELCYKSIRYPGHREYISFLLEDLKFKDRPKELVKLLDSSLAATKQDKVIVVVSATGSDDAGRLLHLNHAQIVHNQTVNGMELSAIELTTSCSLLAVLDIIREDDLLTETPHKNISSRGRIIRNEDISLERFLANRFGKLWLTGHN